MGIHLFDPPGILRGVGGVRNRLLSVFSQAVDVRPGPAAARRRGVHLLDDLPDAGSAAAAWLRQSTQSCRGCGAR